MRLVASVALFLCLLLPGAIRASIFGEELIPLMKLVAGQVIELERLAETLDVAKDQREILIQINDGIERTTRQINAIEAIIERANGLDPSSVRSLSDLTSYLRDLRSIQAETEEVISLKLLLADQAIAQGALQSDTAYKMGQEMIGAGSELASESRVASPGRASQISAAASSSQMLASGVQLQTLAQIAQLQALSLELQKAKMAQELQQEQLRRAYLGRELRTGRDPSSRVR